MSDRELNRLLVERFPELTDEYNEFIEWMGEGEDTGSHNVYGDVFNPYIEQLFEKKDHKGLKRVFEFIEDVLAMDEQNSGEVMVVTVLERIEGREDLRIAKEYFGELTHEALLDIDIFWTDKIKLKNIVALSVNGEMLLEFEDGYANFLKWLKCKYE